MLNRFRETIYCSAASRKLVSKNGSNWGRRHEEKLKRLSLEVLELRYMLAIDTLPADIVDLGTDLSQHLTANPINSEQSYIDFELRLKRGLTDVVIEEVVDFLDQFNPVPDTVSDFLTSDFLDIPGLSGIMRELSVPTTPRGLIAAAAPVLPEARALNDALEAIDVFLDINSLEAAVNQALTTDTIAAYDGLFNEVQTTFDLDLPLVTDILSARSAAGNNVAQLSTLANNVVSTLGGAGPFSIDLFKFTFDTNGPLTAELFRGAQISPLGFDVGVARGGATLNVGTVTGTLDYSLTGVATIADGLALSDAEIVFGIGFGAKGAIGLQIGEFRLDGVTLDATLSGNLSVAMSPAIDANGNNDGLFQASEIISASCYFDTEGSIRFHSGGTYLDPNPVSQISSIVSGDGPAERNYTLFNETLWSADIESCNPSANGTSFLMDGMLIIEGTNANDTIAVQLNTSNAASPKITVDRNGTISEFNASEVNKIVIDALAGDDTVSIDTNVEIPATMFGREGMDTMNGGGGDDELIGGEGNDQLAGGLGDDVVVGEGGQDTISATAGFDTLLGGQDADTFVASGALIGATVSGGSGNDTLTTTWSGVIDRHLTFSGGADDDLLQLVGGGPGTHGDYYVGPNADQGVVAYRDSFGAIQSVEFSGLEPINDIMIANDITIHGSGADDSINIGNGPTVLGTDTTLVDFAGAFEEIRIGNKPTVNVQGHGRSDTFSVDVEDPGTSLLTLNLFGDEGFDAFNVVAHENNLQVNVDGGSIGGTDTLDVEDPSGGQAIVLRQGLIPDSGNLTVGNAQPIVFEDIERLSDRITNSSNFVLLKGDPFEPNDTLATAWYLGSGAVINVDPIIDPAGDDDFFRFVPDSTGTLDVHVFFRHADGDIDIEMLDAAGNIMSSSRSSSDDERVTMPVVAHETYFLRVFGFGGASNLYNFTAVNRAAPIPLVVDLNPGSDSGRDDTDNITANRTPTIRIIVDDDAIDEFTNIDMNPDTVNDDSQTVTDITGSRIDYGVEVFNNGVSIGFAFFTGVGNTWEFTASLGDLDEGDFNHVSAAVWIRDAADPAQIGRHVLSDSLQIALDTQAPLVTFGLPGTIDDGLEASSDSAAVTDPTAAADRVTNDTTPGIWGRAEANTVVRVYHDNDADGVIDLGVGGDTLLGQTVSVPLDGNDAFVDDNGNPLGFWQIDAVLDLNEVADARDGVRRLLVTAEDVAGNPMPMDLDDDGDPEIADVVDYLEVFIDTHGPQIFDPDGNGGPIEAIQVITDGNPDANFNLFNVKDEHGNDQGPTPVVEGLLINVQDLPNRVTGFLYEALSEDSNGNPAESPGNYMLVGDHVGPISIADVDVVNLARADGQPALATIELTFAAPLPDDRYTFTISANLVDPAGNSLDGESIAAEPNGSPRFPSGDSIPGGDFVARFTVDSRPEIGAFVAQNIDIDINGNFVWDPANAQIGNDATNVDLSFTLPVTGAGGAVGAGGYNVHDLVFAGAFLPFEQPSEEGPTEGPEAPSGLGPAADPRYFDQLAAFGVAADLTSANQRRWIIDTNSDGVITPGPSSDVPSVAGGSDILKFQDDIAGFNVGAAIPVAGNFDGNIMNGDEVGLYFNGAWGLDGFGPGVRNFTIEANEVITGDLFGHPIVGDFDGDNLDDLGVFNNNQFFFNLASDGLGDAFDDSFVWGFPGVLDRPVAADFDQDGIDDVGLWVPRNSAQANRPIAEWYLLVSGDPTPAARAAAIGTADLVDHPFEPVPFGNDLYAEFGDELALPIVGNFDPPVAAQADDNQTINPQSDIGPADFNGDGLTGGWDLLAWQRGYGMTSPANEAAHSDGDGNGDGAVDDDDMTLWESEYGAELPPSAPAGDFNANGSVGTDDLDVWELDFSSNGLVGSSLLTWQRFVNQDAPVAAAASAPTLSGLSGLPLSGVAVAADAAIGALAAEEEPAIEAESLHSAGDSPRDVVFSAFSDSSPLIGDANDEQTDDVNELDDDLLTI